VKARAERLSETSLVLRRHTSPRGAEKVGQQRERFLLAGIVDLAHKAPQALGCGSRILRPAIGVHCHVTWYFGLTGRMLPG
jgi:hypothetical protein